MSRLPVWFDEDEAVGSVLESGVVLLGFSIMTFLVEGGLKMRLEFSKIVVWYSMTVYSIKYNKNV